MAKLRCQWMIDRATLIQAANLFEHPREGRGVTRELDCGGIRQLFTRPVHGRLKQPRP